jgi:hypothetical protein
MSTRCLITHKTKDNKYKSIYCHFDGGEHVKSVLNKHYTDIEKIDALMELGDLSALYPRLEPDEGERHTHHRPADGVTVAYHRDRGDPYNKPSISPDRETLFRVDASWIDYVHIFDEDSKSWRMFRVS